METNVLTKEKILSQFKKIEKSGLPQLLTRLYDRWQDEKEYEDWNEYASVIRKSIIENIPDLNLTKITKRPIGIKFKIDDMEVSYFMKINRNNANSKCTWKKG